MKKYIALLLCVGLLLCVTACGNDTKKDGDTASSTTQSTVTTTTGTENTTSTVGDTTATTGVSGTTATPSTDGTTATTGTTNPTKAPTSATTTGSRPTTGLGSTPSSTAPTTGTTQPAVTNPAVVLPAIGSDIDVTGKKDRIRVSAASAKFNADGTIAVTLTFKNYSNWITEETDYVLYTCYDKDGNAVQNATKLGIGCIDTKKYVSKTFTFNVPADTAEVRITRSKIVYWTEWS